MSNPMLDKEFLRQLDCMKHREIYARLTSLTFLEMPIEHIEGRVTGGSINIDGASSSRRTCNLTMIAQEVNINQFYWGLTHKFKVEIGVVNTINPKYDDIIWFNQGKFVITNFNVSLSATSYTITINGKDKMSLLNGDLGGQLTAQTDFASIDTYDDFYELKVFNDPSTYVAGQYYTYDKETDTYTLSLGKYNENKTYYVPSSVYNKEFLPIKTIIREAVHTYGKEPYFNIIINDLEDYGIELLEYRGSQPLYLLLDKKQSVYTNMTINDSISCSVVDDESRQNITLADLQLEDLDSRITQLNSEIIPKSIKFQNDKEYYVSKIEYGDTAGFRTTDLTYAGELIGNIGESLTSVLDKIKNMLGDFEYFYDIDGRFIFQKQKTYQTESWNNVVTTQDNDIMIENAATTSSVTYSFLDNNIVTAFTNTPNLNNLKNDFSIWGVRKGISGGDIPVHLRYAIDKKPTYYKNYDDIEFYSSEEEYFKTIQSILDYYDEQIAIIEQQKQDTLNEIEFYEKQPNPNGLPEEWWNVLDWAEKYKILAGHYPTGYLNQYNHGLRNFNPNEYFPEAVIGKEYRHCNASTRPYGLYEGGGRLSSGQSYFGYRDPNINITIGVFDVNSDGTLGYWGHGTCSHSYGFFMDNYTICETVSYIYDPDFPEADIQAFEDRIQALKDKQEELKAQELSHFVICDWREIIYQMSKDYYKHNQEDDFYSKIMLNNGRNTDGDYYYPNGVTGYEQYYTDINAFWRDLYNIDPEQDYYTQGGYYAENIIWSQDTNDVTFQKEVVWVPYEINDAIFESEYYLPEESKKYDDSIIEEMISVEELNINLQPYVEGNIKGITWSKVGNINSYEIYRSFYAAAGFNIVTTQTSSNNTFIYNESGVNSLGTDEELILYYRIRGYKDVNTGHGETVRVYTQWSNKCLLHFKNKKEIDDDGQIIGEVIELIDSNTYSLMSNEQIPMITLDTYNSNFSNEKKYWNKKIYESPETLNFWFDFLDSDSELAQFAVPVVGDRTKAVNDTKVTSIYFKEIPNIIFTTADDYDYLDRKSGYTYIWLDSSLSNMFSISGQQKSAKEVLDEYLYQFAYCIENVTITTLPIYYLEPNTRIFVYDEHSKINGEYIVNKITIPLTYNGTMSITANKAIDRIY